MPLGIRSQPRPPTLIPTGRVVSVISYGGAAFASKLGLISVTCGATGTLTTRINLTGSGVLEFLGLQTLATSVIPNQTKVTIDGVVVYDLTNFNYGSKCLLMAGSLSNNDPSGGITFAAIPFNASLLVETSNTSAVYLAYSYYKT